MTTMLATRAAMSAADINDLPDDAFAYIEKGGKKDKSGRTVPRSLRHFPVHDAAHVRNALARAPQSPFGNKAMPAIKAAARKLGVDTSEEKAQLYPLELRRQRRSSMLAIPERISLSFAKGNVEMRAKPNGTGGTAFEFNGYAATFHDPFDMWDMWGEKYTEEVELGAFSRTLANKCDVAFLIGHNDAGILMARTKSGTMRLGQDSRGLPVNVPAMDGGREDVRALASAVERGYMDEMSCAFVTRQQRWNDDYTHRSMLEMDLNRGDVSAVVFGANPATAGSSMLALPAESLTLRRPVSVRMPTQPYARGADEHVTCLQCQSGNDADARYCDQCGNGMRPLMDYEPDPDDVQECRCGLWNAADAKVCDQCGRGLVDDHDADDGYPDWYGSRRPGERRGAFQVDTTDGPDYDPGPHAAPGHLQCPSVGCSALNDPDAKHCDQCGASLYSEDGTIILGDSGVPEEVQGDTAMALARSRAELELRRRRLALLSA